MRSAPWAILIALCLLTAVYHVHRLRSSANVQPATATEVPGPLPAPTLPAPPDRRVRVPVAVVRGPLPATAWPARVNEETQSWIVVGPWMVTHQDAERGALEKARASLIEFLDGQNPPFAWTPSVEYIRDKLVSDVPANQGFPEERGDTRNVSIGSHTALAQEDDFNKEDDPGLRLGTMHRVCLKVALTGQGYEDMQRLDRLERSQQRQGTLARILAGLVAVMSAVVGYFRLDEVTRGYYSTWLRLGAISFVGAVGAALVFFV